MKRTSPSTEFTNMIMIEDSSTGKVVVQNRTISWCGYAFPGGHVENEESFYDSAVREAKEETGLCVSNLKLCGIVHWSRTENGERYVVYLYKTTDFSGRLLDRTEEGTVEWVHKDKLKNLSLSPNMEKYLDIFLSDTFCEFFGQHSSDGARKHTYINC